MKPQPGRYASGIAHHPKLPAGSVNVFSIRILSGGYVRWLPKRRARLAQVTDLVEQQTLHREVEAYEARPGTLPPCAGKNRKQVSAFNPLAMERVCHWKMPPTMSNWPSI